MSVKVDSNLQTLTGGLEQKISKEHYSTEVFDIALRYLSENVS